MINETFPFTSYRLNFIFDTVFAEAVPARPQDVPVVVIHLSVANCTGIESARCGSHGGNNCESLRCWRRLVFRNVDVSQSPIEVVQVNHGSRMVNLHHVLAVFLVPTVLQSVDRPTIEEVASVVKQFSCSHSSSVVLLLKGFDVAEMTRRNKLSYN